MQAMQAIIYGYLLVIWYSVAVVLLVRIVGVLSPGAKVLHSLLAASNDRLLAFLFNWRISWSISGPAIAYGVMNRMWDWSVVPPEGSTARRWAEIGAIGCMTVWLNWDVISRGGLPPFLSSLAPGPEIARATIVEGIEWTLQGCVLAAIATLLPGPFAVFGMLAAVLSAMYLNYSSIRMMGFIRRWQAPEAEDLSSSAGGDPVLLFLSDVHVTADGGKQTSGDPSGNVNLDRVTQRMADSMRPRWVVVTGDLVDTGSSPEWILAVEMLNRLRASGSRVILAPGNHDISTAYDPLMAYGFLREPVAGRRMLDASKLADYLGTTALLEGEVRTQDGRTLRDLWEAEINTVRNLVGHWQQAAEEAINALKQVPKLPAFAMRRAQMCPPTALRMLEALDPPKASALIDPLVVEAMSVFATPASSNWNLPRAFWVETFTKSRACLLKPFVVALKWQHLWFDVFPLTVVDKDQGIEFVIVNSNAPETGVLGSGFGRLTEEQTARLRECVSKSSQPIIVVLMHHPICRWSDEPARARRLDLKRWGLLAHNSQEARKLPDLLCTAAPAACRQILLCGGHVHEIARAGPLVSLDGVPAASTWERLFILENPALPDVSGRNLKKGGPRTMDLMVCDRATDGALRPSRIQWSQLVSDTPPATRENLPSGLL
jgi:Calcineurin-like phosphoesterase